MSLLGTENPRPRTVLVFRIAPVVWGQAMYNCLDRVSPLLSNTPGQRGMTRQRCAFVTVAYAFFMVHRHVVPVWMEGCARGGGNNRLSATEFR